ncbi:heavy-metal-associated domain-containing protein [Candidatus Micrarchaeota archaeon]|nr:heavy-metal-associated domain-containing protein [Candidatus Micrarchaeota archaeon]
MKKLDLEVKGMHCSSCSTLLKEEIVELEGVKAVNADFKKGKIAVEFDESKVAEKQIRELIQKNGYIIG